MKINQIIRQKRKELSLTQEQIAAYLGVSAPAVHKWEKGSSYPDITLLPALARLLQTDLNTLLSFQENLSDAEITHFVNEVDKTVREKNYGAAFQMGIEKMQEYPTCENLLFAVTMYLNGALLLYDVPEPENYEETLETYYERLSASESAKIRDTAVSMLIAYNRRRKNYSKAAELIHTLPSSFIDKEEQLAILHTEQEQYLDAMKIWEHRILNSVTEIQTALMRMLEIAVKEKQPENADFYAAIYEQVSRLFQVAQWIPYTAKLWLSVIRQDKAECLSALQSILPALRETWHPQDCPLYSHLAVSETNLLAKRLSIMIQKELENGNDFLFLHDSPEYQQLLNKLKNL